MIEFTVPIRTVNESNGSHGHWSAKSKRRKTQRRVVGFFMSAYRCPSLPIIVTLTRISAGSLDAHDNLRSALKAVVDQIATRYGVPDCDPRIEWRYAQEKAKPKTYGVRIRIETKGE